MKGNHTLWGNLGSSYNEGNSCRLSQLYSKQGILAQGKSFLRMRNVDNYSCSSTIWRRFGSVDFQNGHDHFTSFRPRRTTAWWFKILGFNRISTSEKVCTWRSARFQRRSVVTKDFWRQHKEENWILQRWRWVFMLFTSLVAAKVFRSSKGIAAVFSCWAAWPPRSVFCSAISSRIRFKLKWCVATFTTSDTVLRLWYHHGLLDFFESLLLGAPSVSSPTHSVHVFPRILIGLPSSNKWSSFFILSLSESSRCLSARWSSSSCTPRLPRWSRSLGWSWPLRQASTHIVCCWHCSFSPAVGIALSSSCHLDHPLYHHCQVYWVCWRLVGAGLSITPCVTFSCTARSFTCCAWSAGLTSTTVLSLRAPRVKVWDLRAQLLWFASTSVLALANGLSIISIVLRVYCFGLRAYVPPKLFEFCSHRCVWPCASCPVGTSRHRHARFDRPVSMSGGASHWWSAHHVRASRSAHGFLREPHRGVFAQSCTVLSLTLGDLGLLLDDLFLRSWDLRVLVIVGLCLSSHLPAG